MDKRRQQRKRRKAKFLQALFEGQKGHCFWCMEPMIMLPKLKKIKKYHLQRSQEATIDHVVQRALGGKDDIPNIVAACQKCNSNRERDLWSEAQKEYQWTLISLDPRQLDETYIIRLLHKEEALLVKLLKK